MSVIHIVVAMKPVEGNFAQNAIEHGVSGLNVDECRIGVDKADDIHAKNPHTKGGFGHCGASIYGDSDGADAYNPSVGRFPSNVILSHHPECQQSGVKKVRGHKHSGKEGHGKDGQIYAKGIVFKGDTVCYTDEDGQEEVADWICHPDCPVKKIDEQSGIRKSVPAGRYKRKTDAKVYAGSAFYEAKTPHQGAMEYGDEGGASRFFKQVKENNG